MCQVEKPLFLPYLHILTVDNVCVLQLQKSKPWCLDHILLYCIYSCKTPSSDILVTHCKQCWECRKQWAPQKPTMKRRKKKNKITATNSVEITGNELTSTLKGQEMCMFCEKNPRNSVFIHGRLGHQV